MSDATTAPSLVVPWPADGVFRVHFDPAALPRLGDAPGANRFDDPRPRTEDRFLIRYCATTLRGCLLELLAALRDHTDVQDRINAVDDGDDEHAVLAPQMPLGQHISDYLHGRQVARVTADEPAIVSIDDPALQHQLDTEPAVRAILDSAPARAVLLPAGHARAHLDNAAIRLASETGRYITQACALALHDRASKPDVIHFRSRHDDAEDCWAIYDHTPVGVGPAELLSPHVPAHIEALRSVAELWDLPLPEDWR